MINSNIINNYMLSDNIIDNNIINNDISNNYFNNKDSRLNKINLILKELNLKYSKEPYILDKLNTYIHHNLFNHLDQICIKEYKKHINLLDNVNLREEKKAEMIKNQEIFINKFLQINLYFYIANTDIYIYYDNIQFKIIKEDDILHNILTNISLQKNLIPWKHKIKFAIIKNIKEQNIFKAIPNSETIQNSLNILVSNIFLLKEEAKYFLTIIGDIILKKNENLIYLINNNFKDIYKLLSNHCYYYFGINLNNNFKYKYHEQHNHENYRLIKYKINKINTNEINKNILDIFCVAIHYSNRFENADKFLKNIENEELTNYCFYLKTNSIINLIDNFINKSLIISENTNITFKNMIYIWKLYLEENKLPALIFQNTLKTLLKEKINYNEEEEIFVNIFSPSLPLVSNFIEFWENTITESDDELGLELSEIVILFKLWNKIQINIKSSFILDFIKYYYPDIIIEEDKYILNIKCSLWNKKEDINKFLQDIKLELIKNNAGYPLAIEYLYDKYCIIKKNNLIINKKYFEKYINDNLNEFMDNDNLIQPIWWFKYN